MTKLLKNFGWMLKIISAIFILVLAFVFITRTNTPQLILITVGGIFVLLGLVRVVPLLKTTENKVLRAVFLLEIVIDIGVGAALLVLMNNASFYESPWFGRLTGAVLYLRGIVHLMDIVLLKGKNDIVLFWFHIVLLTAGVYLVSSGTNVKNVITFIFVLAIICALYLGWDGYHGYNNYRRFSGKVQIKTTKKKVNGIKDLPVGEPEDKDPPTIIQ
jgi:hypothetical protein